MRDANLTTTNLMGLPCWVYERRDLVAYRIKGIESRDFLHRMSTNHVRDADAGSGCLNVFPDRKGRMVAMVHQSTISDKEVILLALESAPLDEWLDQFLFMEEIEVSKESKAHTVFEMGGSALDAVTEKMFGEAVSLPQWAAKSLNGSICFRSFDCPASETNLTPSLLFWFQETREKRLTDFENGGAAPIGEPEYETLRILAGIPMGGREISSAYNPLELGLHDAIHWDKGCYIGQEVIARIDNYDKQSRRLVGLVAGEKIWETMSHGDEIFSDGKTVGRITSVSPIFSKGQNCALAVVKMSALSDGDLLLGQPDSNDCSLKWNARLVEQFPATAE